jgi:hypothetical protein
MIYPQLWQKCLCIAAQHPRRAVPQEQPSSFHEGPNVTHVGPSSAEKTPQTKTGQNRLKQAKTAYKNARNFATADSSHVNNFGIAS